MSSDPLCCLWTVLQLITIHDFKLSCALFLEVQVGNNRQDIKIFTGSLTHEPWFNITSQMFSFEQPGFLQGVLP